MSWHTEQWGVFATFSAGFMALAAAIWTIAETRRAASKNASLLREQIAIQREEIDHLRSSTTEASRRDFIAAAQKIHSVANATARLLYPEVEKWEPTPIGDPPTYKFPDELKAQCQTLYPLLGVLELVDYERFTYLDDLLNGQKVTFAGRYPESYSIIQALAMSLYEKINAALAAAPFQFGSYGTLPSVASTE